MIEWRELADDILRRLNSEGRSISSMHKELRISRATMHRLASGKPVEASTYLAVCQWLGYSPFLYFREPSKAMTRCAIIRDWPVFLEMSHYCS